MGVYIYKPHLIHFVDKIHERSLCLCIAPIARITENYRNFFLEKNAVLFFLS